MGRGFVLSRERGEKVKGKEKIKNRQQSGKKFKNHQREREWGGGVYEIV